MKSYLNIEKSGFHPGQYVGYADGAWRITRSTSSLGNWCARHQKDTRKPALYAFTLDVMSEKLAAVAKTEEK